MGTLSIIAQLILSLSILVTLHECGHFFPAKWFKTRVEKFYLFFNPYFELWKKKIGETEYGIGWVPFGGYVKISGMIDESMDTDQMSGPVQPWEFRAKPAWQRLIIMIGGVTVNFVLGFLIFAGMLWYWGESYVNTADVKHGIAVTELGKQLGLEDGDNVISIGDISMDKFNPGLLAQEIILNSPETMKVLRDGQEIALSVPGDMAKTLTSKENKGARLYSYRVPLNIEDYDEKGLGATLGLKKGDQILSISGTPTPYVHNLNKVLMDNQGKEINVTALRGTDTLQLTSMFKEGDRMGTIYPGPLDIYPVQQEKYSLAKALPAGVKKGVGFLTGQLKAFGQMFSGKLKATDSLGSIVSIARLFDASWDWQTFWQITAMLSILLAFFNLLPIPALDGGYVMFLLWEVLTGRKVSDKTMEWATTIGFFLLIGLMIFALGLDFSRLF